MVMCVGVGVLRGIRDCGYGTICSYVGVRGFYVGGGFVDNFWCLLLISGLLILAVVGLPLGCCGFVCMGLPHLYFWEKESRYVTLFSKECKT